MSKPMAGINVEAFTAWCDRLDSGEIPQGKGSLHNDVGMCCLGVVCDMTANHLDLVVSRYQGKFTYNGRNNYLPPEVKEFLGIPDSHAHGFSSSGYDIAVTPPDWWDGDTVNGMVLVSVLNDNGYSHPQIAGFLRREFLECDD